MTEVYKGILPKDFFVEGKYKVLLFIKQGINAETYRLKGTDNNLYFLKLFNYSKLSRTAFDDENNLLEIELLKDIKHPNIASYKDSGELIYEGKKFGFLVLNSIAGETLSERISGKSISTLYDVKKIITGVLEGLNYLHSLPNSVIHNEITPQNIMLDMSSNETKSVIIDFGYARSFQQSTKVFNKESLNLNYVASECFNNSFSPQSDLFSVGAVMYHLLYGVPPWSQNISNYISVRTNTVELVLESRKKKLELPNISKKIVDFEESIIKIIKKALNNDPALRFQSANDFIQALEGKIIVEEIPEPTVEGSKPSVPQGKGFSAIAGMQDLKDSLRFEIIEALLNPSEYEKFGIPIPNGMLLYGPPGCGKTFFAKNFAEETGWKFLEPNLKSQNVGETEVNIVKMFIEAEKEAPIIIFIDEINGLLPKRGNNTHFMSSNAVDEMLKKMDRTGEKKIFIIGATNYPDNLDPALLRSGRLEKKFYIGPPDFEARKALFELYLKKRPLDFGIEYEKLARLTENYVASDIKMLIDEAAKKTLKEKGKRITMETLEFTIKNQKPTVSLLDLKKYEEIRRKIEEEN